MQKIVPSLWFDKALRLILDFYTSTFGDVEVQSFVTLHETPSGNVDIASVRILDHTFTMMTAGPLFKFTPAISFLVSYPTEKEVEVVWNKLAPQGRVLMPLDTYPFSNRYGWIEDKYGLSWQIMCIKDSIFQKVIPTLLFVGNQAGKTEEAMNFYISVFKNGKIDYIMRYGKNEEPDKEGTIKHAQFTLQNQRFAAMDSAHDHKFGFNEAISFEVYCDTQEEIDYYWEKLSADPSAEQCGWLKDKYGVSWQIVPAQMKEMMKTNDKEKLKRVTQAFLQMKKFDIAQLQKAYDGE